MVKTSWREVLPFSGGNGETFKGSFSRGLRSGWGIVSCPEKDIMAITGNWKEGELEGKGRLVSNLSKIMVQF